MTEKIIDTPHDTTKNPVVYIIAGFIIITLACAIIYGNLFRNPDAVPWGSDTLGHVFRYEFLRRSIEQDIWFPDFVPDWYLGIQLFRYYPALLYYPLAVLSPLFENPVNLSTWFIVGCTWMGGVFWLLFTKKIGWLASTAGGVLYLLLPDMVRVAFAEGNLLRHFSNALLPLIVFLLITAIQEPQKRRILLFLGLTFSLMVLSHPMMASITAAMSVLYITIVSILHQYSLKHWLTIASSIILGTLIASFWLLPSLTGGITEISKESMIAGLPVVPVLSLFSPETRHQNMESLYIGISLVLVPAGLLLVPAVRKNKDFWALVITGLIGCLLVTPILNPLFYAIPLSTLMWPARFLTAGSFFLLFGVLWSIPLLMQNQRNKPTTGIFLGLVLFLVMFDFWGSKRLIFNRESTGEYETISSQLATKDGWREATLDYSAMASNPSYYASNIGRREQLYGWGFQGARTAVLISGINEALAGGNIPYVIDRLNLAGVDDLWVAKQVPQPYQLDTFLAQAGFSHDISESKVDTYHRSGNPRGVVAAWQTAGIGTTIPNYTYLFPQVIPLDSPYVDDYTLDQLMAYNQVVLAGFTWHDKTRAEELVTQLAQNGVRVIIDLTKSKENPLSQQPTFLNVWGEPVILDRNPMTLTGNGKTYQLTSFHYGNELWYTITPQNLDHETLSTDFLGQALVFTGYKQVGAGKVWFIGLNLVYQAVMNGDKGAVMVLEDLLGLKSGVISAYQMIELEDYSQNGKSYHFQMALDNPETILLPFAHFDGTRVLVDDQPIPTTPVSSLIQIHAPAGVHTYTIMFEKPLIYKVGGVVSVLSLLVLTALTFLPWRKNDQ